LQLYGFRVSFELYLLAVVYTFTCLRGAIPNLSYIYARNLSSTIFVSLGMVSLGLISIYSFVGLAASGYNEGFVWSNFEWLASVKLIILSLIFAPLCWQVYCFGHKPQLNIKYH